MQKIIILPALVLFFSLLSTKSIAQDTTNATIDSLIMLLMNDHQDEARVDIYNSLSDEYEHLNPTKTREYAKLAYDLSGNLKYESGKLKSALALGHYEMAYLLDFKNAREYYDEALTLAQKLGDKYAEMKAYQGISYIYGSSKNFDKAEEFNKMARDIASGLSEYYYAADLNAYMGGLAEDKGDTALAVDYYAEVLAIERAHEFTQTSNASMVAIARYYYLIKDPGQSLKYYRIALKNFERVNDLRWVSYTHSEMANLYVSKGDLSRAEQHALKGLEIAEKNELRKELGDNYLALVHIYNEMDSAAKAEEYSRAYDSLQDSLIPIEEISASLKQGETPAEVQKKEPMNGFLQAIIICLPVVLLILIIGLRRKSA